MPIRPGDILVANLTTGVVQMAWAFDQRCAVNHEWTEVEYPQQHLVEESGHMTVKPSAIILEEVTDPAELDKAREQDERFARNWAWFEAHAAEIYASCRGKCICVAGEELFVADTPQEALAMAIAAHPNDDGRFTRLIPRARIARIYADQGHVLAPAKKPAKITALKFSQVVMRTHLSIDALSLKKGASGA
jgi:hypothetical protein